MVIVVYSDLCCIGIFVCSDECINWFYEVVVWLFCGNVIDILIDCLVCEWVGWIGDW